MEAALAFAAILAFVWGMKYVHTRKRQEERQMIHRERILAMEKGIPLPEFPIQEDDSARSALLEISNASRSLLPKLTLGCGLIVFFLGTGVLVALKMHPDSEMSSMWTMSFIPIFVGVGFLLYHVLLRWTSPSKN